MSTDDQSEKPPGWLKAWLAAGSALVVFRVCKIAWGLCFFGVRSGYIPCPVAVIAFLHRWDSVLVTAFSLIVAVLAARWIERKFVTKSKNAGMIAAVVFSLVACFPFDVETRMVPIMASPLEIAISHNYSLETLEALLDRYPRLVNGSDRPWDHFEPLLDAALDSKTNLVNLFIRKGANVDAAIRRALQLNDERAVKLILDCSTNFPNSIRTNGASPGH